MPAARLRCCRRRAVACALPARARLFAAAAAADSAMPADRPGRRPSRRTSTSNRSTRMFCSASRSRSAGRWSSSTRRADARFRFQRRRHHAVFHGELQSHRAELGRTEPHLQRAAALLRRVKRLGHAADKPGRIDARHVVRAVVRCRACRAALRAMCKSVVPPQWRSTFAACGFATRRCRHPLSTRVADCSLAAVAPFATPRPQSCWRRAVRIGAAASRQIVLRVVDSSSRSARSSPSPSDSRWSLCSIWSICDLAGRICATAPRVRRVDLIRALAACRLCSFRRDLALLVAANF